MTVPSDSDADAAHRRVRAARTALLIGGRLRDFGTSSRDGQLFVDYYAIKDGAFEDQVRRIASPVPVVFQDGSSAARCGGHDDTPEHLQCLLGLTEDEALIVASRNRWEVRLACLDGASVPGKADLRPSRVNLHVVTGLVAAANCY